MFRFKKERVKYYNNSQNQSDEEKTNSNNNETDSKIPSFKRYRFRNYRRQNKTEETQKNGNSDSADTRPKRTDNIRLIKTKEEKQSNKVVIEPMALNNEDDSCVKENSNPNINSSKKNEILERLKDIVPIVEDTEGEDNLSPDKERELNSAYSESKSLSNKILTNEFKIEDNYFNDNFTNKKKLRNSMIGLGKHKKKYDNELIDVIKNVEKNNVDKYLSKDLANIYNEMNKDDSLFKNDAFLADVDIFEKKNFNLDKKKQRGLYGEKKDKKSIFADMRKPDDIINQFFEKYEFFQ